MSQEPVKLVVFVHGGVVQEVMTCGVHVQVAVIDEDDGEHTDDPGLTEMYPECLDPAPEQWYRANGFVWDLHDKTAEENAYAMHCFDIAAKACSIINEE